MAFKLHEWNETDFTGVRSGGVRGIAGNAHSFF